MAQVHKIRDEFGIHSIVLVGDRGMISQKQIDQIRQLGDIDWITALKTGEIRKLLERESLQMSLFDERNLFELTDPAFPGERLVACRNPLLAKLRAHTRQSLIAAATREFEKVQGMVTRGRLKSADEIGFAGRPSGEQIQWQNTLSLKSATVALRSICWRRRLRQRPPWTESM